MSAFEDFEARVNEVAGILKYLAPEADLEEDLKLPLIKRRPFSDSTLARSCTVLMVSYFEGFTKDLADDSFDLLLENEMNCSALNGHFRGHLLARHLNDLRAGRGPRKDWDSIAALLSITSKLSSADSIEEDLMPREQAKRVVTSIDPQKINELFRIFGDSDLSKNPISRYGERLKSLKTIRDNAVHGNENDVTPLSLQDAMRWGAMLVECAREMSEHMDALLEKMASNENGMHSLVSINAH